MTLHLPPELIANILLARLHRAAPPPLPAIRDDNISSACDSLEFFDKRGVVNIALC